MCDQRKQILPTSLTIDETTMTDTVTAVASKQKSEETEKLKMHDKIRQAKLNKNSS